MIFIQFGLKQINNSSRYDGFSNYVLGKDISVVERVVYCFNKCQNISFFFRSWNPPIQNFTV